jgi:5-oxopent-3-ene-1,2,5-tricarboxylate decarboxylase / 2-hydroxyhepta-2,4-diene-1,7-dioate isomerase
MSNDRAPSPPPIVGTVFGALLNHRAALDALGDAVHQPPYKAPPNAPVLAIKPCNTHIGHGDSIVVPRGVQALEMGAALGIVIGRTACRVALGDALDFVAGYTVCNDVSVPHASHYRPALRHKCRDTFLAIGPCIVDARQVAEPDALGITVRIDGEVVQRSSTAGMLRPVARLIADVTEFMTLSPGDVLMLGVPLGAPLVRAGQTVSITIDSVGTIENPLVDERDSHRPAGRTAPQRATDWLVSAPRPGAPPRTARVAFAGAIHQATPHERGLRLADGRVLAEHEVVWLPPFEAGTVIALGINYADHARELAKELTIGARDEPLAFLKSSNALLGHRGQTRRPRDAAFMHYECELAVVIGRVAKNVKRADAMAHVAGYTVANDYAVRDCLENWYRPNLRAKNRDGATALGPWLVAADAVPDPHALNLRTFVNGRLVQSGNTRDLVNDIPALIEYLSGFMTLVPGDVILTGTPEGVVNVNAGDEVVTEIDGIGRLVNTLVDDAPFGR